MKVRVSCDLYSLLSLALVGVNGGCHAYTLAGLLSLCLGNEASPRGPKFGINIPRGNGPPFAACHQKIGGSVLAGVPPAEQGPAFPVVLNDPSHPHCQFPLSPLLSLPSPAASSPPSSHSTRSHAREHEKKMRFQARALQKKE